MKQGRQRRKNRCVKWRERKKGCEKKEIKRGGKGCEKGEREGGKKDMKEGSLEKRKLEKMIDNTGYHDTIQANEKTERDGRV